MKKYNIKVNFKGHWMEYTNCYFIDSLKSYKEYLVEFNNKFAISESEIKNLDTFIGHAHSQLTGLSGIFCGMIHEKSEREPMLVNLKLLQGKVLSNQLKDLLDGKKLVINKFGGYFTIGPEEEYEITKISDSLYSEKDIKIKKWYGGRHFYAKVDNVDVIDEYGNVKWNTEKRAYEKVLYFMKELNGNKV